MVAAAALGPVVVEELVAEEREALAHQCPPRVLQHRRLARPPPQRDQTSAVLPASEAVLATGPPLVMRRAPPREHPAQAIAPPSHREIARKSDRGLITALVLVTDPRLEQELATRVPEPTDHKSARFPRVAIALV